MQISRFRSMKTLLDLYRAILINFLLIFAAVSCNECFSCFTSCKLLPNFKLDETNCDCTGETTCKSTSCFVKVEIFHEEFTAIIQVHTSYSRMMLILINLFLLYFSSYPFKFSIYFNTFHGVIYFAIQKSNTVVLQFNVKWLMPHLFLSFTMWSIHFLVDYQLFFLNSTEKVEFIGVIRYNVIIWYLKTKYLRS